MFLGISDTKLEGEKAIPLPIFLLLYQRGQRWQLPTSWCLALCLSVTRLPWAEPQDMHICIAMACCSQENNLVLGAAGLETWDTSLNVHWGRLQWGRTLPEEHLRIQRWRGLFPAMLAILTAILCNDSCLQAASPLISPCSYEDFLRKYVWLRMSSCLLFGW